MTFQHVRIQEEQQVIALKALSEKMTGRRNKFDVTSRKGQQSRENFVSNTHYQ
jgi:hypothetical protein